MGEVLLERIGRVQIVTISNERKRNAVDVSMELPLLNALTAADADEDIGAVIITGAGGVAFCSGHDLSEIGRPDIKLMKPDPMAHPDLMRKPVIAAINGHCHAAGLMMALCCDLRVASENAVFGQPAARIGGLPVGGQIWRLSQALPKARALEMMFTAEFLSAQEAHQWGMVNKVVPEGQALVKALEIAQTIAGNSPTSLEAIKKGFKVFEKEGIDAFNRYENEAYLHLKSLPSRSEGINAFFEKRKPAF